MKTPCLFLLAFIFSLPSIAQKIETFYDYRWKETTPQHARFLAIAEKTDSGWHRRDYFIKERSLQMEGTFEDSLGKISNGLFRYFHSNGTLSWKGRSVHGRRDGLWLGYHNNGVMSDSTTYSKGHKIGASYEWYENGYLSDSTVWNADGSGVGMGWFRNGSPSYTGTYGARGKRQGNWQYFHRNGKPSAIELYENGKLINKQYFDEQGNETDTVNKDRPASFPGGPDAWKKYLGKKLYFPSQYKLVNADQAIVVIEAIIDEAGNVTAVAVNTPFHPEFDKIALEVVRKSPKWEPAIQHNRIVQYKIKQPVVFGYK